MVLYQLILQKSDTGEDFRKENGDLLPYNIKEAKLTGTKRRRVGQR